MKTAYLLSLSAIEDDPRVRRMGDALHAAGWRVVGVGLDGARAAPPEWRIVRISDEAASRAADQSFSAPGGFVLRVLFAVGAMALYPVQKALAAFGAPHAAIIASVRARLTDRRSHPMDTLRRIAGVIKRKSTERLLSQEERMQRRYWRRYPILAKFRDYVEHSDDPGLWVANDWIMLPIAAAGKASVGGAVVYDSHEFAIEQYAEDAQWRRFVRPLVRAIEERFISEADIVSAVSPGILEKITALYQCKGQAFVLRNAPPLQNFPQRPLSAPIRVLYHGVCAPARGLEALIASVPLLDPRFTVTIRGPFYSDDYRQRLKDMAGEHGAHGRVAFLPPVAMHDLVREAVNFDIGILALPGVSLQKQLALPNKVFEYMMAGLALAVTDLPEMSRLVDETKAGVLIRGETAEAIAKSLNALNEEMIESMRAQSRRASRTYNYERQSAPVLAAYEALQLSR